MSALPPPEARRLRLLQGIHEAVDHGDRRRALRLLTELEMDGVDPDSRLAHWRVLSLDEELEPARVAAEEAVTHHPDDPDLQHALGWTLLGLGLAERAIPHLEEACYLDEDFADAWHDLAVAREWTGDQAGMAQAFGEVYDLDTAEPKDPLRFSTDQVMQWASLTLERLPQAVREAAAHIPIFVQDYPDAWILEDAPWDPRLLGLFDGPTYAEERRDIEVEKGSDGVLGAHIYLYPRNLERLCPGPREMAKQVRITVQHELGHYLGLGEGELQARGLA